MDIQPLNNLTRIVEHTRHGDHEQPKRREPPRKKEKIAAGLVYTPDGHVEEGLAPKIDVVA